MKKAGIFVVAAVLTITSGAGAAPAGTFGAEVQFLKRHVGVIVLADPSSGARVAIVAAYEGRVMTSSAGGRSGTGFGWINHALIASGKLQQHMNAFGGEDRFWLGPEGGQYGLFFKKGVPFDLAHWFTPAPFDTQPFTLAARSATSARFTRRVNVANHSGTHFTVSIDRRIRLLPVAGVWKALGIAAVPGVKAVGYETDNRITNVGRRAWTKAGGLLSIWILGQFQPGPETTIVIPFRPGPGRVVNDAYFGKVPANRLVVKKVVLFFRGDGRYRSKIGISPAHARPILGSYDPSASVLTLVQYTLPSRTAGYVNSMWRVQRHPYGGDVANSYNDGPPAPGAKPLGPFYELETSSPAAALKPGQSISHVHRTIHLQGPAASLNRIAQATLGVPLAEIESAFTSR